MRYGVPTSLFVVSHGVRVITIVPVVVSVGGIVSIGGIIGVLATVPVNE